MVGEVLIPGLDAKLAVYSDGNVSRGVAVLVERRLFQSPLAGKVAAGIYKSYGAQGAPARHRLGHRRDRADYIRTDVIHTRALDSA